MSWSRFVFVSDNHGDEISTHASKAFLKFLKDWKPKIRIHGGDNFDFRPLRRKASEEEKRELMRSDFDAGMKFLDELQPTSYLRGNHCERLWMLAHENRGIISEYATSLIGDIEKSLKSMRCKMLPYDKRDGVLHIGKLRAIHGYTAGAMAARRSALAYGSVLMGHAHSIQSSSVEGLDNRVGRICGCLCNLNMEYSRATMASLVHRHGWAYGVINDRTGEYQVWQAEEIGGKFIVASDTKQL